MQNTCGRPTLNKPIYATIYPWSNGNINIIKLYTIELAIIEWQIFIGRWLANIWSCLRGTRVGWRAPFQDGDLGLGEDGNNTAIFGWAYKGNIKVLQIYKLPTKYPTLFCLHYKASGNIIWHQNTCNIFCILTYGRKISLIFTTTRYYIIINKNLPPHLEYVAEQSKIERFCWCASSAPSSSPTVRFTMCSSFNLIADATMIA